MILGISGLTGYKIAQKAVNKYDIHGTFNARSIEIENCDISKLDLTKTDDLKNYLATTKPDVIINTTALHDVDYCEENKEETIRVNKTIVEILYSSAERINSRLIHISTDYVFDGNAKIPYSESSQADPLNHYGKSKLDGEKILQGSGHVVVQPSVVYGWTPLELAGVKSSSGKPINFAMWILMKLNKQEQIRIVTDQFASATLADSLAESIIKIVETDKSGLYHISGLSCESRYEFAIKLAKKFGYDSSLISPTTSESFVQKAKRPVYSCLDCQKAIKDFGLKLLTTDESLDIMKSQIEKEASHLLGNYK